MWNCRPPPLASDGTSHSLALCLLIILWHQEEKIELGCLFSFTLHLRTHAVTEKSLFVCTGPVLRLLHLESIESTLYIVTPGSVHTHTHTYHKPMLQISSYASQTLASLPELVKTQIPGLYLRVSESVGLLTSSPGMLGPMFGGKNCK